MAIISVISNAMSSSPLPPSPATTDSMADRAVFVAGFAAPILPGVNYSIRHICQRTSTPSALYAILTQPPAAGEFIFDVERSQDSGVTWASILANPITIPAGTSTVVSSTAFASSPGVAPGNILRPSILSSGLGPGFSNGFTCVVSFVGAYVTGWDRANFAMGFNRPVPINRDNGVYFIATQTSKPDSLYVNVTTPPSADVALDIQLQQTGGAWVSILSTPLTINSGATFYETTSFNSSIVIQPGNLLRTMFLSGPAQSGMGYNLSLEMEIS